MYLSERYTDSIADQSAELPRGTAQRSTVDLDSDSGICNSVVSNEVQDGFQSLTLTGASELEQSRDDPLLTEAQRFSKVPSMLESLIQGTSATLLSCIIWWINALKERKIFLSANQIRQEIDRCQLTESQVQQTNQWLWESRDKDGDFEALCAAAEGDDNTVNLAVLMANDAKVLNACNNEGRTVMHFAVIKCKPDTVRNIVTKGGDCSLSDIYGDTPMHLAAQLGRHDVILAMSQPLTRGEISHNCFSVPYQCLPMSDSVRKMNHQGWTAVHVAAEYGHRDALVILVKDARADIDCRRLGDGYCAAHIAVEVGRFDLLKDCLELGSDSEVRNYRGETPQQMAFLMGRQDMVMLCQQYGAAPRQLDYAHTEQIDWDIMDEDMDHGEASRITQASA